jgi:gliding motility-associated-like protein
MLLKLLGVFVSLGYFLFLPGKLSAQNCVLTGLNNTSISSSCNQACRDLSFQIPDIRSTSDYKVLSIPYNPYPYVTAGATEDPNLYNDDKYSAVFNLPFPFCFYDSVYKKALISSNGLITFDTTYFTNCFGAAYFITSTIPNASLFDCSVDDYPRASIMAAFMDLDPRPGPLDTTSSSPRDRKIEWRVEGTAPCRRFVVSYFHIGAFLRTPCGLNPDSAATFQIVMYESTGLIDVFLQSKFCKALTGANAILGVQDFSRTRAVAAPGKNATTWTASNEGYRFVPSGGASRFVSSELLTMNLSHIAFANSSRSTPGLLDLTFPNICSAGGSTQYIVKTTYSACDNPAIQLTSMDTITLNQTNPSPTVTVSGGTFCATGTTTLTTTGATGGTFSASPAGLTINPTTGVINLAASTPNTYTIIYSFGTAPCNGTATSSVTVSSSPTATVSGGTFCATGTTTLITTGATGGTFSALPAGLVIDAATGVIDLATSTPNTYTITYSFGTAPCNGTATSQVTVSSSPTAIVSGGTFCATGTVRLTTTGATGGTFAASPAGLNINTTTGVINLATSTPNTYTITYSFGTAPCNGTATSQVTVSTSPTATVSGGTFCATGTTTLTATGATGGTFSVSPAGLNINTTTGVIDLATSTPNTYTITYSFGTAPCNGTATSQLTVSPVLTTTVNKTDVLCNGGSTGTITVAQPTTGIAPYQYSLDGITWQDGNLFNGLVARTYIVYYRDSNRCQGSQSVIINEPAGLAVAASANAVVCNGQGNGVITVNASGGVAPYQYSINGTTYQTNNTLNVPAGTYTVYVKDNNGCINTIPDIEVIEPPLLTLSTITQPASCNGVADGLITVTAGGGNPGYHYSIDGVNFQSSNLFRVTANNYTVTVKDQNNCIITKNATVGLNNNLTFSKGNDTTICEGGSARLIVASNATAFTWTPSTALNNSSIANPVASPTTTTEYTVTATLQGCNVSGKIRVIVNTTPIPDAGTDVDICFGQNARLSASGGTSYQWTPSTYLSSATIPDPTVIEPKQTTQYRLQVKDANGCTSLITDDVLVKVTPPIKVVVSPKDSVVAEGDQIQFNATSNGTSYKWTNSFTLSNPDIPNPVAVMPPGSTGNIYNYTVTASTSAGCKGVASATLKVYKGPEIYVPTGFTPNADGKNDKFYPITVGIKEINYFKVFNRWGQMVFSTSKLNEGWDGKLGGIQQSSGVYVWIVQATTRDNKVINKKGTVMLIR